MPAMLRTKIADFILETEYDGLPLAVVHQSKRCLLDFLGVALASEKTDLISNTGDIIFKMGGEPEATIIGEDRKVPVLNAVLINGIKGHTLDMDDGNRFGNVHPAVVVFPAALALAEQQNITGQNFIASIIAGYETLLYIAKNINPSHLQRGFHTTANVGAFGAAAACSKILGLNKAQVENALSIAGLCGGGLLEVLTSGQMMKPFQTARAAQAGLMAALLAEQGARGPELVFEGEKGFFRAYADKGITGDDFEGLGTAFEIMNAYFKIYSACRHIHPALDAVAEIVKLNQLAAEKISAIEIETYSIAYSLTSHRAVEISEAAAKFSMPISVALMLVCGRLDGSVFTIENIKNPLVQSLADKITISVDRKRDVLYPKQRGAKVAIKTGGKTYSFEVNHPKGEPENPLSDDELIKKFRENAELIFSQRKAQEICQNVFNLENINIANLAAALSKSS